MLLGLPQLIAHLPVVNATVNLDVGVGARPTHAGRLDVALLVERSVVVCEGQRPFGTGSSPARSSSELCFYRVVKRRN